MTTDLTLKQQLERCERWLEDKTIEYNKIKTELEELKRDVKRYFELVSEPATIFDEVVDEFYELREKIVRKVGKEE